MIFNKFFILFKIGRKIGKSNIINIVSETHKIPVFIKLFFNLLAFSFSSSTETKSKGKENLSESIQEMGTTFIKLGQFLATRPDIIGEKLSKELEEGLNLYLTETYFDLEPYETKQINTQGLETESSLI